MHRIRRKKGEVWSAATNIVSCSVVVRDTPHACDKFLPQMLDLLMPIQAPCCVTFFLWIRGVLCVKIRISTGPFRVEAMINTD